MNIGQKVFTCHSFNLKSKIFFRFSISSLRSKSVNPLKLSPLFVILKKPLFISFNSPNSMRLFVTNLAVSSFGKILAKSSGKYKVSLLDVLKTIITFSASSLCSGFISQFDWSNGWQRQTVKKLLNLINKYIKKLVRKMRKLYFYICNTSKEFLAISSK